MVSPIEGKLESFTVICEKLRMGTNSIIFIILILFSLNNYFFR